MILYLNLLINAHISETIFDENTMEDETESEVLAHVYTLVKRIKHMFNYSMLLCLHRLLTSTKAFLIPFKALFLALIQHL